MEYSSEHQRARALLIHCVCLCVPIFTCVCLRPHQSNRTSTTHTPSREVCHPIVGRDFPLVGTTYMHCSLHNKEVVQYSITYSSSTIMLTSHKWRELVLPGRLICRCHDVFFWCYVCFVSLRCPLYDSVQAEVIRSIVLRYASASITTCVSFFLVFFSFCLFGDVAFSEYFIIF